MDTIIPSMLIKAGGNSIHLGLLTAIMIGGTSLFQIFFASYLSYRSLKRKYLLTGINLRIIALFFMAALFVFSGYLEGWIIILLIFLFISMFSFSGSFANVSYVDILGKAIHEFKRKKFFSLRQVVDSVLLFGSALLVRYLVDHYEYPVNYSILFFAAAFLLLTASLGFWNIHEPESKNITKRNLREFFRRIPGEIRQNPNLKYYLILINTIGLGLSILPFFILLAKDNFGLTFQSIGNFLLFRTIGMLAAGLFLYRYSRKFLYKDVLKIIIILAALLPLISLLMVHFPNYYTYIFILSGIFFSLYKIILNGVLLEISTHENRAIYTGISGAGNIATTIFPIFAGFFISVLGYKIVFISISLIIFTGYYSILKMRCPPEKQAKIKSGK
ncbi:MAG: MFS transporter [Calditrichaceae bacterium]|nr:MFS transporter [Calditrichaceae bacterium]